jgi:hypothetical protein
MSEDDAGRTAAVEFACKIFGDVVLVTAVSSGEILSGCTLTSASIRPGTKIVSQLSGIPGGLGRYLLSLDQTPSVTWDLPRYYKRSTGDAELRDWYLTWLGELQAAGRRSTAAADWQAAQREFPGRLRGEEDRDRVRALRRELAPDAWKQKGRPPGSKAARGRNP